MNGQIRVGDVAVAIGFAFALCALRFAWVACRRRRYVINMMEFKKGLVKQGLGIKRVER